MAHFARIRILGGWSGITVLSGSEMEALDLAHFKSINGDEGGAWMPSAPIEIGGSGVDMGGLLNIGAAGEFNVDSGATFTIDTGVTVTLLSAITASGGGTLTGTWTLGGAFTLAGSGSMVLASGSEFTSAAGSQVALLIDGATSGLAFQAGAFCTWATGTNPTLDAGATFTFDGAAVHNGATTLAGAVTLSGAMTCSEPIDMASNGTIGWRAFLGTDADIPALSCEAYDQVHIVASTPSANRTYTLTGTPVDGQRFRISYAGASFKVQFVFNGGADSYELKNVAGSYVFLELAFISGAWRLANFNKVP